MKKKKYIIFAGVNGAGKSSLYNDLLIINPKKQLGERINTDEIVKEIGDWKRETDQMKAGRIALNKIKKLFEEGISFNQETTLCGNSIIKNIYKAKQLGYKIELYFVSVETPEIAKERIRIRVANGGHGIADSDVERRFIDSRNNLKKILKICDDIIIYDNTESLQAKIFIKNSEVLFKDNECPKWMNEIILEIL